MKSKLLANMLFCTAVFFTGLNLAQVPTASFSTNSNTVCAGSPVQVLDQTTNTPTGWSYSVNGVATSTTQSPEFTFTVAGTYSISLVATNGSGASGIYTETVLVNALPSITVAGSTLICSGTTSTLSASGADTYTWDSGSNFSMIMISPVTNTSYTVIGTNTLNGCSDSSFVSVTTQSLPLVIAADATICPGSSHTIIPSGAANYTFSSGSPIVSPAITTVYIVSGTDLLTGCTNSTAVLIVVQPYFLSANSGSVCSGLSYTINPSGAVSYTFSSGSNIVSPTIATVYTVTGTNPTGCVDEVTVTVAVAPGPTIHINTATLCAGTIFTLQPTGAVSYSFPGGSNTVAPLTNTIYVIGGTNPMNGCPGFTTASFTVSPAPLITINNATVCAGDVYTLNPGGASSYTFSGGTNTVAPVVTTSYSITGTSGDGCVSLSPKVVTIEVSNIKPNLSFVFPLPGAICAGETIVMNATGASSYTWSTGALTASAAITLSATTLISVYGSDGGVCTSVASTSVYVYECTGLERQNAESDVRIYPNPARDVLNIEASEPTQVCILNALGEILEARETNAGITAISLERLAEGVYFLRMEREGEIRTTRVIKH